MLPLSRPIVLKGFALIIAIINALCFREYFLIAYHLFHKIEMTSPHSHGLTPVFKPYPGKLGTYRCKGRCDQELAAGCSCPRACFSCNRPVLTRWLPPGLAKQQFCICCGEREGRLWTVPGPPWGEEKVEWDKWTGGHWLRNPPSP